MNKKALYISLICSIILIQKSVAQADDETPKDTSKMVFIKMDFYSLINNYPSILISVDYMKNPQWLFGVFAGPVLQSEITVINSRDISDDKGYKLGGESKYYFSKLNKDFKTIPFFGASYTFTHTSFNTSYILNVVSSGDSFYKNIQDDYIVNMNSFALKTGIITSPSPNIYIEGGFGFGYFKKSISPTPSDFGEEVVKNGAFVYDINKSGFYYSFEFKIGWKLSR